MAVITPEAGQMLEALAEEGPEEALSAETKLLFVCISIGLVIMAGLMSGLTIGLMAMDDMEMELLKDHHFLLSTLVLWNAASMEALPIFLDKLADPVTAVILSVTVVLIFGEIVPQGICTRYGLAVGYYASWLLRVLMVITFPVAYPLGKILDYILGHSAPALPRGQLQQFVSLHGENEGFATWGEALTQNETQVINSALELTSKTAKTAYTPLEKVFMVPSDAILDQDLCAQILKMGHSRVPVHQPGDRKQILGILLVKELLLVKEPTPVGKLKMRSVPALSAAMPMWDCLQLFKIGRAHMAVLCEATEQQKQENVGKLDRMGISEDLYEGASSFSLGGIDHKAAEILRSSTRLSSLEAAGVEVETLQDMFINATIGTPIGIITMEDVVEELLGSEIIDETDRYVDNMKKKKINAQELSNSLPGKLRALLRMGVFTSAIRPGVRQQSGGTDSAQTPLLLSQGGTSSGGGVPGGGGVGLSAPGADRSQSPSMIVGGYKSPQTASQPLPPGVATVVLEGSANPSGEAAEYASPTQEAVTAAIQTLEQTLDKPEITDALGTLQEAGITPLAGTSAGPTVVTTAPPTTGSGTTTPSKRRPGFTMASTKRSASMHLREKTLAGLSGPNGPPGAVMEGDAGAFSDDLSVDLLGGPERATVSGTMDP